MDFYFSSGRKTIDKLFPRIPKICSPEKKMDELYFDDDIRSTTISQMMAIHNDFSKPELNTKLQYKEMVDEEDGKKWDDGLEINFTDPYDQIIEFPNGIIQTVHCTFGEPKINMWPDNISDTTDDNTNEYEDEGIEMELQHCKSKPTVQNVIYDIGKDEIVSSCLKQRMKKKMNSRKTVVYRRTSVDHNKCCIFGCLNWCSNRLRFSLRDYKTGKVYYKFKEDFVKDGKNWICNQHYFQALYRYNKTKEIMSEKYGLNL